MDIYVAHWTSLADNGSDVTLYYSEDDAHLSVCEDILEDISNNWDLSDENETDIADRIRAACKDGDRPRAIRRYNDHSRNCDGLIYSITVEKILGDPPEDLRQQTKANTPYVPAHSGATCRGRCGQYNEYANADNANGTFLCHQCKTLDAIFNS